MILVTGGSGFIGSHLLDALASQNQKVRAIVRRAVALPAGVEAFQADLATGANLDSALDGVSTVIHLAGATKALNRAGYYAGNATASANLAQAAGRAGARFLHISSLAVCGPSPGGKAVTEDYPPQPISDYGKSKLAAEQAVRDAIPSAVIIRPPVVYGPRETGVLEILQRVARGWAVRIGGGEHWFSMIYVHDLVAGMLALLHCPQADGHTYFLGHRDPVSWAELDTTAAGIMNRRARVLTLPVGVAYTIGLLGEIWAGVTRKPATVSREKIAEAASPAWVCDSSRLAKLGIVAPTAFADGLAATLAWYKEAGWIKY